MSKWFAEEKEIPDAWSWVILVAFSLSLMGWGIIVYLIVDDGPRNWDYGRLPYIPAESAYWSHVPPTRVQPPRQLPKFPGARPLKPEEMSIQEKRP